VTFDLALTVSDGTGMGTISDKEEFLLYSTNLDHYPDDDSRLSENYWSVAKPSEFDCYFVPYSSSYWGTGGRVYGFYPRREKISSGTGFWSNENINGTDYNLFSIFLETNKPKSAEVVRIASNQKGSPTVKDASKEYNGMTFRSVTFELANYRPFRFAAQVNGEGKYVGDDATSGTQFPEVEDNIEFTYLPDEIVEVAFDVTTFTAQDGVRVSPFGTGFEIFIDAPMLTLEKGDNKDVAYGKDFEDIEVNMFDKHSDGTHYVAKKPKLEDLGNGRFVYRVDSDPNTEASYWDNFTNDESAKPKIEDQSAGMILWGDRKTIRFRKNSIVSSGKIVVSANPEHVTFHSKIFNINNKPIMGRIEYMKVDDDGNEVQTEPTTMPADQFVSVSRVYDDSRIGSLIVKAKNEFNLLENTYYELRLRGEYEFKWTNDPIKIQTQVDGKFYSITLPDLKYLYENTTIVLKKE
jgi:hypothetical protein